MENNLDNLDAFYGFDPNFDPNRQAFLLNTNPHQTWPLPLSPNNHMSHNNDDAGQQQQQRRLNTVAATSAGHNGLPTSTSAVAPLQTTGLPFGGPAMAMNPMLADWMGFTANNFA